MFTPDLTGASWAKSSFSSNGECVELAHGTTWVAMRDSKDPEGPALVFTPSTLQQFLAGVKSGQFDLHFQ